MPVSLTGLSMGVRQFISILMMVPAIMLATCAHEASRALISTLLGDDTPKKQKRLTLNPLNHFEPIGFLLMLSTGMQYGAGIGWGKPVPTNPRFYKNRRAGILLTAIWPQVTNLLIALACSYLLKYGYSNDLLRLFLMLSVNYNISLIVCNLLPVSPFDCLKVIVEFMPKSSYFALSQNESIMQLIMIILIFSGLLTAVLAPVHSLFLMLVNVLTF